MPEPQLARRMSAEDASYLYFEKPDSPLHIGSVAFYEGKVPYEKVRDTIASRMHLIPRYRQRAMIPPFYAGHPTWEDDPTFSIDNHIKVVDVPAPGTFEQVLELSTDLFSQPLPRNLPLWDITLVHGLQDGNTAYVSRVHHCLVDGASGVELLLAVLDLVPDPEPTPQPAEPWKPNPAPDPLSLWADATFDQWQKNIRAYTDLQQNMLDTRGWTRQMSNFARAIEITAPAFMRRPARAPWNAAVSAKRRVAVSNISFQEVRGIRSVLGGTVNDVVLTILGGALGRYLLAHGHGIEGRKLRFSIPVNVRKENERGALGNRVSMMLPDIPAGIADPVARLEAVREEMGRLKEQDQSSAIETFIRLAEIAPAALHALAGQAGLPAGQSNVLCTNVPGPLIPLYSVGHRMLSHYPLIPLAGDQGIAVGILSYDKSLYFGIMYDPSIIKDADIIGRYLEEEFIALRGAAGVVPSDLPAIGISTNGHSAAVSVPPDLARETATATG